MRHEHTGYHGLCHGGPYDGMQLAYAKPRCEIRERHQYPSLGMPLEPLEIETGTYHWLGCAWHWSKA